MNRRRGWSVTDLLVVLAIIGVLIALLIPAIQAAREAARRAGCKNKLHELGVALANCVDTMNRLPPANVATPGDKDGKLFGPLAFLLPFLEQQPVYENQNFSLATTGPANATARRTVVKNLLCPNDRTPAGPGTNYLVNAGWSNTIGYAEQRADSSSNGLSYQCSGLRLREVRDGTSKTIAFAETLRGEPGVVEFPGAAPKPVPPTAGDGKPGVLKRGDTWMDGLHLKTVGLLTLGVNSPHADTAYAGWSGGAGAARSAHPAAVNVCMLDATVPTIGNAIDPMVWKAVITSNGGEPNQGF